MRHRRCSTTQTDQPKRGHHVGPAHDGQSLRWFESPLASGADPRWSSVQAVRILPTCTSGAISASAVVAAMTASGVLHASEEAGEGK